MGKTRKIIEGLAKLTFVPGLVLTLGFSSYLMIQENGRENVEYNSFKENIQKAKRKSAGKDKVWSAQEKEEFLNYFGIDADLKEHQDIYFKEERQFMRKNTEPLEVRVDVILGYHLKNSESFLDGSENNSDITYVGFNVQKELDRYLQKH